MVLVYVFTCSEKAGGWGGGVDTEIRYTFQ